ncbi:MAG: hypothetical protein LC802_15010 [Acidobacteria bacterium]|nr:hypothetical protein [Acidobacteriota bacterium]
MLSSKLSFTCKMLVLMLIFCASGSIPASAQAGADPSGPQQTPRPAVNFPVERAPAILARESETACAGFIEQMPPADRFEIVGAEDEALTRLFAEGDYVFINAGAQQGVRSGQEFSVVRPRGQFSSKFSGKRGSLGVFTQEVGRVRVVRVKDGVSVALVVASCDNLLLGDLLRRIPQSATPVGRAETDLDRFTDPTGKQAGRIVLARDNREVVSRDQVVFIDLGAEDNLKPGDYLTVYRPVAKGVIVNSREEIAANARRGFESDHKRGGQFSNQAQRLKDVDGSKYGPTVKTPEIRRRRPPVPRRVLGEIVVLHVEGRTATAVVTRVAQEIHTGDYVEVQ